MNVRDAILATANTIEAEPGRYDFWLPCVRTGSPMCLLGWIGAYAGIPAGTFVSDVAQQVLGIGAHVFYDRLGDGLAWTRSAKGAARALRAYAEQYHPAPPALPAPVREIFARGAIERQLEEA